MSYVAFDLDNTLGYFYHVMPVASFLSAETLENNAFMRHNVTFRLSTSVKAKMAKAEVAFLKKLIERPHLAKIILRPNIDALMRPVLTGLQNGRVRGVAIYSNTENTFAMRVGQALLEARYGVKNIFCAAVDATNPIRKSDRERMEDQEPLKTYPTLKAIFRKFCGARVPLLPRHFIFVDERPKRHVIANFESEGLTYIQPTVYSPEVPRPHKKEIFKLLLDVLEEQGLMADTEYMESCVFRCMREQVVGGYPQHRYSFIDNFQDLASLVAQEIAVAGADPVPFKDDTVDLRRNMLRALARN